MGTTPFHNRLGSEYETTEADKRSAYDNDPMAVPNPLKEYPPEVQLAAYGEAVSLLSLPIPGFNVISLYGIVGFPVLALVLLAARKILL